MHVLLHYSYFEFIKAFGQKIGTVMFDDIRMFSEKLQDVCERENSDFTCATAISFATCSKWSPKSK